MRQALERLGSKQQVDAVRLFRAILICDSQGKITNILLLFLLYGQYNKNCPNYFDAGENEIL
jgi:hypothetical protein